MPIDLIDTMITVLHVDDEPVLSDITKLSLERSGKYCVDTVNSARTALDMIQTGEYECIISDYEMPDMNGLELLKAVRSINPDIPFILFSGRGRESVIIEALNSGADFYLQKGGEPRSQFAELEHKITYAIEQHNTKLALKRRDAILSAVSLAANLVLTSPSFTGTVHEILTLFGLATEMDRVYLFKCFDSEDATGMFFDSLPKWCRPGIPPKKSENLAQRTYLQEIISYHSVHFREGKPITGSVTDMDPFIREMLILEDIKSIGLFPIFVEQKIWGCIGFEDLMAEREWREVEVDAILAGAGIIGSALTQQTMNTYLTKSHAEYKKLYSMVRLMCDTVPDMIWAKDMENRYIFVNKSVCQNLLCVDTIDEPIGKTNSYFVQQQKDIHPDGAERPQLGDITTNTDLFVLETKKTGRFEEIGSVNGKTVYLDVIKTPLRNELGEMIGTVGCARDITEERINSSLMIQQNSRYEAIFQKIHSGLIICEISGEIIAMNKRAVDILFSGKEPALQTSFLEVPVCITTGMDVVFDKAVSSKKMQHGIIAIQEEEQVKKIYYEFILIQNSEDAVLEVLLILDEHYKI